MKIYIGAVPFVLLAVLLLFIRGIEGIAIDCGDCIQSLVMRLVKWMEEI